MGILGLLRDIRALCWADVGLIETHYEILGPVWDEGPILGLLSPYCGLAVLINSQRTYFFF